MDAISYLVKGRKAYNEGDFKLAMVLLRRTGLCNANTVELYANAAYEAWKSPTCKISPAEIKEAYKVLFSTSDSSIIKPFEFVRLAQIYISYGLLVGAMEVMTMAVNVGNLDQCIVLLQTWTLMRKLSSTEQTYEYMEAIAEMVTMQVFDKPPNDEEYLFLKGTDIPLYAVYMHCAFHTKRTIMQNKYQFKYEKDNALQKYNATMSEAYTFYFKRHPRNHKVVNDWFEDPNTWMEMGYYLETTSVPLLAEESYWVCFVSDPLHEEAIFATLAHLKKTNRPHEEFKFLEKAYWANSWNVRIRNELVEREEGVYYKERFRGDVEATRKIQAAFRGYFTRENWEQVYEVTQQERAEFFKIVDKGKQMREVNMLRDLCRRLHQWHDNILALKELKKVCSVAIQMSWRGYISRKKRMLIMQRMRTANGKFFFLSEFHHNLYRSEIFKEWKRLMQVTRSTRCAKLLIEFITTSERRKKFYWAGDKLRNLLRVRRRHGIRVAMRKWRAIFLKRKHQHAVACIRFFVRDAFLKMRRRLQSAQISLITSNNALQETKTRLDQHLLKAKFIQWRCVYIARQSKVATRTLATRLPIIFARKKARRVLSHLRVRREWVSSQEQSRLHREYNHSFYRWRLLTSTLRIQRFTRIFLAKCAVLRKHHQKRRIAAHGEKVIHDRKMSCLIDWRQFQRRRAFRRKTARYCLARFMRKYAFICKLSKILMKNSRMIGFLVLVDTRHKKKCFGQLHRMVFGLKKYMCMKSMCAILNRLILADSFSVFKNSTRDQHRMRVLVGLHIRDPLERMMTRVSEEEGWTYRSNTGYSGGEICIMTTAVTSCALLPSSASASTSTSLSSFSTPVDIQHWPRLLNTAESDVHMYTALFDKKKVFQAWAFAFRLRAMRKVHQLVLSSPLILQNAISSFQNKRTASVVIQKWARGFLSVFKSRRKRLNMLVFWEKATLLREMTNYRRRQRNFHEVKFLFLHSKEARLVLQCFARQCLARAKLTCKKVELGIMQQKEHAVFRLRRQRALSGIMRLMEFGCAMRCCAIQLASPRERHYMGGGTKAPLQSLENKQSRVRLVKKNPLSMKDFASEEYHRHLFRLKQTGVLVVDSSNMTGLNSNELAFLIQSAATLFSQANGEHHAIRDIANNFRGNKLIFCGGVVSEANAHELYYLLTSREEKVCVNFSEVMVSFKAVSKIARSLEQNFAKLRVLSVDSVSMGSLGIAALLVALKGNLTLETFAVKITSSQSILPCHEECVKLLVQNSYLQELRLFGVPLTHGLIAGLMYAVSYGFSRLALLEFDYLTKDMDAVQTLVNIGKNRESKRTGSNTFVNVTEIWSPDDVA